MVNRLDRAAGESRCVLLDSPHGRLVDAGFPREPFPRPAAAEALREHTLPLSLRPREWIVAEPADDAGIEPNFDLGRAFLPVFEADWVNAKFGSSDLSVQPSVESGLADTVADVAQIVGIA